MSKYNPDRWKVLEFNHNGDIIRKVFAGWGGGYTTPDTWKLSSGITETEEFEDRYEFLNHSGSTYICYKQSEGYTGYMLQIFAAFTKQVEESNGAATMKVIDYESESE